MTVNIFTSPVSVIGPTEVVPKPTFVISIYSSLIFMVSPVVIEDIPVTLNVVTLSSIANSKLVDIGVNAIGDWMTPSIDMSAFSFFLNISNSWLFPAPELVNVKAIPARASALFFATKNESSKFLAIPPLIANRIVPSVKAPPAVAIPDTDAPVKVEPAL